MLIYLKKLPWLPWALDVAIIQVCNQEFYWGSAFQRRFFGLGCGSMLSMQKARGSGASPLPKQYFELEYSNLVIF